MNARLHISALALAIAVVGSVDARSKRGTLKRGTKVSRKPYVQPAPHASRVKVVSYTNKIEELLTNPRIAFTKNRVKQAQAMIKELRTVHGRTELAKRLDQRLRLAKAAAKDNRGVYNRVDAQFKVAENEIHDLKVQRWRLKKEVKQLAEQSSSCQTTVKGLSSTEDQLKTQLKTAQAKIKTLEGTTSSLQKQLSTALEVVDVTTSKKSEPAEEKPTQPVVDSSIEKH